MYFGIFSIICVPVYLWLKRHSCSCRKSGNELFVTLWYIPAILFLIFPAMIFSHLSLCSVSLYAIFSDLNVNSFDESEILFFSSIFNTLLDYTFALIWKNLWIKFLLSTGMTESLIYLGYSFSLSVDTIMNTGCCSVAIPGLFICFGTNIDGICFIVHAIQYLFTVW